MVLQRLNMEDILDACFGEELFTTPLCHSKKKGKKIESRNPWKYADQLSPIYETHKVSKDEISRLCCRVNYKVSPSDKSVDENDMLYRYFAQQCGQDRKFMRTWLHLFIHLHKHFFNSIVTTYLGKD